MDTSSVSFGSSALLRFAGLPIRFWLMGANPGLFSRVRTLSRAQEERAQRATALAKSIGEHLVPAPGLRRKDRAFLLQVRRTLHRGDRLSQDFHARVRALAIAAGADPGLVEHMDVVRRLDAEIEAIAAEVDAGIALEQERVLHVPQEVCRESPLARNIIPGPGPDERAGDVSRSPKRRRHRFEHEWQHIERATSTCTPRGWYSHVAMVPVATIEPSTPLAITGRLTVRWMEDVRDARLALTDPLQTALTDERMVAVNPLHWEDDGLFVCIMLDHTEGPTQVSVRHTPLLDSIYRSLAHGRRSFGDLARSLGYLQRDEREALREFACHLLSLGILQIDVRPLSRSRSGTSAAPIRFPPASTTSTGWLDVYRHAQSAIPASLVGRMESGTELVLRILALARNESRQTTHLRSLDSGGVWTFQDVVRDVLDASTPNRHHRGIREGPATEDFPEPTSPGYGRLIQAIADKAGQGGDVTIDTALLDACGASVEALAWPIDCLVRVPCAGAGYTAVLDQLWPPGTLDSRFADTLSELHGSVEHVDAYRDFLRQVEDLTGYVFVELLAPPLTEGAANAVRRPAYTNAWTGDPHTWAYLPRRSTPGHYISPRSIQIRRIEGTLRATVNGRPIWVVHHATRSFSSPWDQLSRVLLATAPVQLPWDYYKYVNSLLTFLPDADHIPRIRVEGGVVVAPEQWLVSTDHLWDRGLPLTARVRALDRLRDRYSLPRWVQIHRGNDRPPLPCDLESIHAVRTIESGSGERRAMRIIEMLPAPDQFLLHDQSHQPDDRLASQMHVRFPFGESTSDLANRVARDVLATHGPAGTVPAAHLTSRRAREPPETSTGHAVSVARITTEGGSP